MFYFILIFQLYPTFLKQNLILQDLATHNCVYVHTFVCMYTHLCVLPWENIGNDDQK